MEKGRMEFIRLPQSLGCYPFLANLDESKKELALEASS